MDGATVSPVAPPEPEAPAAAAEPDASPVGAEHAEQPAGTSGDGEPEQAEPPPPPPPPLSKYDQQRVNIDAQARSSRVCPLCRLEAAAARLLLVD